MEVDLTDYSLEARERIARTARRSPSSEASVICSAGGAAIAVALFVFSFPGVFWLSSVTGLSEIAAWVAMSFGIAAAIALANFFVSKPKIEQAKALTGAFSRAHERQRRAETEARIKAMSAESGDVS
ncbi:MAG: hypothetical protein AAGF13_10995 [Pseudomonadota bacterium]